QFGRRWRPIPAGEISQRNKAMRGRIPRMAFFVGSLSCFPGTEPGRPVQPTTERRRNLVAAKRNGNARRRPIMKIELRPITSIQPYENNPRINDQAIDAVAASLREFGFRQPIVVDAEGVIIAGHVRYLAALKLGLKKVPVHVAKDLTAEQIKAYRIADNKTADLSDWNYDLLPIELADLQGKDYDLSLLGFNQDELASLLDPGIKDGLCDPDEVPAAPDEATTRTGDLWILGDHRLLCGDAGKPEDVDRLLDGAK